MCLTPVTEDAAFERARHSMRAQEMLLIAMLLCGVTTDASAEDPEHGHRAFEPARDARLSSGVAQRFDVGALGVTEARAPAGPYAPTARSIADTPPASSEPLLHPPTILEQLNDFRSRNGVRLLTLWQSAGSAVSLQTGRHGGPSLQWTSRTLNRGGSTRGLLDHVVASSLGAAGVAAKPVSSPRSAGTSASAFVRPLHLGTPAPSRVP